MKSLSLAFVAAVVSTAAFAAAPAMTIGSLETKLSQEDCLALGAKVMRGSGLTKNFETVGRTVYGETGDNTGAIRCMTSFGIVLFVVAGPTDKGANGTDAIEKKLKDAFGSP